MFKHTNKQKKCVCNTTVINHSVYLPSLPYGRCAKHSILTL